jgi:acyl-ACP thioesterase
VESAELVAEPAAGRVFERELRPGIADAVGDGRVRLDAIARWLQDVAYADLIDAGFEERGVWIVRRMRVRVVAWPRFGEPVALRTFCSGLGRFAAERRTSIAGASSAVEAVALWVWIDESGRPARFDERFTAIYATSAGDRGAPVRLRHPDPPAGAERRPWTFRVADLDVAGHVNNSHYWEPLEELLAGTEPAALEAEIEHRDPALAGTAYVVGDRDALWVEGAEGAVHASIQVAGRG